MIYVFVQELWNHFFRKSIEDHIVQTFGHFLAIWYILRSFGLCFPVLVCCTNKNVATLLQNELGKLCRKMSRGDSQSDDDSYTDDIIFANGSVDRLLWPVVETKLCSRTGKVRPKISRLRKM
jgi:hypothetical protein